MPAYSECTCLTNRFIDERLMAKRNNTALSVSFNVNAVHKIFLSGILFVHEVVARHVEANMSQRYA